VGARSDAEVYDEMNARVHALGKDPHTIPSAAALESLGKLARGMEAQPEAEDVVPRWLVQVLTRVVGMPPHEVQSSPWPRPRVSGRPTRARHADTGITSPLLLYPTTEQAEATGSGSASRSRAHHAVG